MIVKFPTAESTKVATEHSLKRKRKQFNDCKHTALSIDEERGLVTCKTCNKEMSCLEGICMLADRIWWEENRRERQIEYDLKRVSTVQAAAVMCLYEAGVTPEKYAERWNKEHSRRTALEIQKEQISPLVTATANKTPA